MRGRVLLHIQLLQYPVSVTPERRGRLVARHAEARTDRLLGRVRVRRLARCRGPRESRSRHHDPRPRPWVHAPVAVVSIQLPLGSLRSRNRRPHTRPRCRAPPSSGTALFEHSAKRGLLHSSGPRLAAHVARGRAGSGCACFWRARHGPRGARGCSPAWRGCCCDGWTYSTASRPPSPRVLPSCPNGSAWLRAAVAVAPTRRSLALRPGADASIWKSRRVFSGAPPPATGSPSICQRAVRPGCPRCVQVVQRDARASPRVCGRAIRGARCRARPSGLRHRMPP